MTVSSLDLAFPAVAGRDVRVQFDGGDLTSDAGLLLVRQAERRLGVVQAMAEAIEDRRDSARIRHSVRDLVRERIFAIAAGYEDANDLDDLREDPALKLACEKRPTATNVLGSQPTMSRLENAVSRKDLLRMAYALAERVIGQLPAKTRSVTIDVDPYDDPCHGQQQFEEFNGYYDEHCYLPFVVYVSGPDARQRLVAAVLRPGRASYQVGLFSVLRRVFKRLRGRFPGLRIVLRADSAFGKGDVLRFCHRQDVRFVLGLPSNVRLAALSTPVQMDCALKHWLEGDDTPEYAEFAYKAGPWERKERVVLKCEVTGDKLNPRYVVTDLAGTTRAIYRFYCRRGDRENRIKELKLDLSAGRTSCHRFLANQCRLLWHAAAYALLGVLQEAARGTGWAGAQMGTLRLRLLKVAARVVESCRRIVLHLPNRYVDRDAWVHLYVGLAADA